MAPSGLPSFATIPRWKRRRACASERDGFATANTLAVPHSGSPTRTSSTSSGFAWRGGIQKPLWTEPNGVVLNPEIVKEFFGDEDPLGKTINCQDGDYIVTGILEPLPRNSMIHFNFVTGTVPQNIRNRASWDDFRQSPRRRQTVTFIRLRQGADPKALEAKLPAFASTILPEADRSEEKFVLQGFLRMRLHVREDFPTGARRSGLGDGTGQSGLPASRSAHQHDTQLFWPSVASISRYSCNGAIDRPLEGKSAYVNPWAPWPSSRHRPLHDRTRF